MDASWTKHLNNIEEHEKRQAAMEPITPAMPIQQAFAVLASRSIHVNSRIAVLRTKYPQLDADMEIDLVGTLLLYFNSMRGTET